MSYYPILVNLTGRHCLVVGAGQVGRRKIQGLLESEPASVLVIDTRPPDDEMQEIARHPAVRYEAREFVPADLDDKFLVIASTTNEELNWSISRQCRDRSILCNIVDQPEKCSFIVPAVHRQGGLILAVSTGGASPALARKIREDFDEYFGSRYAPFLEFMARLRPMILALGKPTEENSTFFRGLINSGLMEALSQADKPAAESILKHSLPHDIQGRLPELLNGLC